METKVQTTVPANAEESARIYTAGEQGLGEQVVREGRFSPGEKFEVIVRGGKIGYNLVAEADGTPVTPGVKGALEAADYQLASESLTRPGRQASRSEVLVAEADDMVVRQGHFKPGDRYVVITDGGKIGFKLVGEARAYSKESA